MILTGMGGWFFLALVVAIAGWRWIQWLEACKAANKADWGRSYLNYLDGLNRLYCHRFHRLDSKLLPLPVQGGALVVANHISGLDPQLLVAISPRPLRFLIAREQYQRIGFRWLFRAMGCIPVDRDKRPEKALRAALLALRAGEVIALFPQGGIHLDTDPPRPLKRGVAWLALQSGVPIYALHIEGVKGQGQILGALLQRSRISLHYHPPISCVSLSKEECLFQVAQIVRGG
ncbi:lysophospholipid acyltransferase family protein [Candidatus Nitrosoglobus terrae]|uniref:lysophospholipid acyltransferase family protein n=1 Tax=Candidatus Nitrosoglobus terrae TaxID=1630141 RepID=UPI001E4D5143|nr:lysophospholipid acyltransferase family protein [Candidatus Nitrosoglobus terrae]